MNRCPNWHNKSLEILKKYPKNLTNDQKIKFSISLRSPTGLIGPNLAFTLKANQIATRRECLCLSVRGILWIEEI